MKNLDNIHLKYHLKWYSIHLNLKKAQFTTLLNINKTRDSVWANDHFYHNNFFDDAKECKLFADIINNILLTNNSVVPGLNKYYIISTNACGVFRTCLLDFNDHDELLQLFMKNHNCFISEFQANKYATIFNNLLKTREHD